MSSKLKHELGNDKACTICFRYFASESEFETNSDENRVFRCCEQYLHRTPFDTVNWGTNEQNNYARLCPQCFHSANKLFELYEQLKDAENKIQHFVNLFSAEVEEQRLLVDNYNGNLLGKYDHNSTDEKTEENSPMTVAQFEDFYSSEDLLSSPKLEIKSECEDINDDYEEDFHLFPSETTETAFRIPSHPSIFTTKCDTSTNETQSITTNFRNGRKSLVVSSPRNVDKVPQKNTTTKKYVYIVAKRFSCSECKQSFNFSKELVSHSMQKNHKNEKHFCCDQGQCKQSFYRRIDLKCHRRHHHSENVVKCRKCHQKFNARRALVEHKCATSKKFNCKKCEKSFTRKFLLNSHLCKTKTYDCTICESKFTWKLLLLRHLNEHNGTLGRRKIKRTVSTSVTSCRTCGKVYAGKKYKRSHNCKKMRNGETKRKVQPIAKPTPRKSSRGTNKISVQRGSKKCSNENFQCNSCSNRYMSKSALNRHTKYVHKSELVVKHTCEFCGKEFSKFHHFKRHLLTHSDDKLPCPQCDRKFTAKDKLKLHISFVHHKVFKHKCETCGKVFIDKYKLNQHLLSHTGEKAFKCETCERSFTYMSALTSHMRVHKAEKPFQCEMCGNIFKRKSCLQSHMLLHHLGGSQKSFKCEICGNSYTEKSYLTIHRRTHTGEKPFKCTICERSFSQRCGMNSHMKTHNAVKAYQCEICGKHLATAKSFRNHKSLHENEKPDARHTSKMERQRRV